MAKYHQQSIDFYDQNASDFIHGTLGADMQSLYRPFEELLQPGCHILDAGCGSGRDSNYFLQRGYLVTSFDASSEMVSNSSKLTGLDVRQMTFDQVEYIDKFDGVWACASLLHVPLAGMDEAIRRLCQALVAGGIFYLSFKSGEGEHLRNGRLFTSFTEQTFRRMLSRHPELLAINLWTTTDVRPGRDENWLNILLRKT